MNIQYMNNENKGANLKFLAIDPFVSTNIVEPTEIAVKDKGFISWGEMNNYPDYIEDLYDNVPTLQSIVNGLKDYICGDGIETTFNISEELVECIAFDLALYNGFALNIIRNKMGGVENVHYLDFKRVRSNAEGDKFYYSVDWGKSFGRVKYLEYDNFFQSDKPSTILYVKNRMNKVYPSPMFSAAVLDCEIEKQLNIYNLNSVMNGFSSNYIVNFNNGIPSDEVQNQIEEEFYDKFTGTENAGRPMLSFNNGKDNETTITSIDSDNFVDKYKSLQETTKQNIFTAFRGTPNLFGIPTETTGFSEQEYAEAFKLFNRTVVKPLQRKIERTFDKIFKTENSIKIIPFTI